MSSAHLEEYDPQTQVGRIPAVLPQTRPAHGKAAQPRTFRSRSKAQQHERAVQFFKTSLGDRHGICKAKGGGTPQHQESCHSG